MPALPEGEPPLEEARRGEQRAAAMGEISRALAGGRLEEAFALLWKDCGQAHIAGALLRALLETQPENPFAGVSDASVYLLAAREIEEAAQALSRGDEQLARRKSSEEGFRALRGIANAHARARTRAMTTSRDCVVVHCGASADASGFCEPHKRDPRSLIEIANHEAVVPLRARRSHGPSLRRPRVDPTAAELACLECAARGLTAKKSAELLSRSVETIKSHRRNVIARLSARNITHAVAIAWRRGFLTLEAGDSHPEP